MSDAATPSASFPPERLLAQAGWVRRLAGRLLANPDAADDLAQETLALALAAAPADPERSRGWLATIARHLAWGERERSRSRVERERRAALPEALPSAVELDVETSGGARHRGLAALWRARASARRRDARRRATGVVAEPVAGRIDSSLARRGWR
ncbi:MAG: hypothetical protein EXR73_04895 [Myxococcales bacterium]|nr:hypothetical protein [Myxococcales bacterium]